MHTFIYSKWLNPPPSEPHEFYSELDERRYEVRKLEIFPGGRVGWATRGKSSPGTALGLAPVPSTAEVLSQRQFDFREITQAEFEKKWSEACPSR